jgi:hypothetical protein
MRNCTVGFPATGDEAKGQRGQENCGFPHVSLYLALALVSTLFFSPHTRLTCASVGWYEGRACSDPNTAGYGTRAARRESAIAAY